MEWVRKRIGEEKLTSAPVVLPEGRHLVARVDTQVPCVFHSCSQNNSALRYGHRVIISLGFKFYANKFQKL